MEEKNNNNVPIHVTAHTSDSEHDLRDDEWSPRQQKLIETRLYQVRRRTVAHWKMRQKCLTFSQIFTLPSVLLGAVASTTQYSMLGTDVAHEEVDTPNTNHTTKSETEIKMVVSVIMTSIVIILVTIVQFFRFQSDDHREAHIIYFNIFNLRKIFQNE